MGRRIEKAVTENSVTITTRYLYNGFNIIAEYDDNNVKAQYIHNLGIDDQLAMVKNGQTYYYHKDGLGSITKISDSTGSVVQSYEYDSFGNITNQTGSIIQPYTFTGREYDSESGLLYLRARELDSKTGTFTQKDPIGFGGGDTNLYRYVSNNPINFVDPMGLHTVGFNGTAVLVVDDDNKPVGYYPATSGRNGITDPSIKDYGPIPAGSYTMYPSEFRGGLLRFLKWTLWDQTDWGWWRVPLHPDTDTNIGNRTGGFFIHGGMYPGSKGCIDIGSNDTKFHDLLKNHKGPVKIIVFYPGLFIIPISRLKRRRLRFFITNGFIHGLLLSVIYSSYIFVSNLKWSPPEPGFVSYIKGLFVLLFLLSIYACPLYFYRKYKTLVSNREFITFWETAWLFFCIYMTTIAYFVYVGLRPDDVHSILLRLKDNPHFWGWVVLCGLFLKDVVWKFLIGNLVSIIILCPFIFLIKKWERNRGQSQ